jgi:hypothetical protein
MPGNTEDEERTLAMILNTQSSIFLDDRHRIGYASTAKAMDASLARETAKVLWVALTALEELVTLLQTSGCAGD